MGELDVALSQQTTWAAESETSMLNVRKGGPGHSGKNLPFRIQKWTHLRALGDGKLGGSNFSGIRQLIAKLQFFPDLSLDLATLSLDSVTFLEPHFCHSGHECLPPIFSKVMILPHHTTPYFVQFPPIAFHQNLQWPRLCRNTSLPPFSTFRVVWCHCFRWSWLYHNTTCTLTFSHLS